MRKRLLKRAFSTLLAFVMLLSLLPVSALAETTATWTKVELEDIKSTDTIAITMTTSDGKTYALSNANGTTSAPTAVVATVSGTTLTTGVSDTLAWNIASADGGYIIYKAGTTDTWLYSTNTNNGVRVGTNTSKVWSLDSASGYLKHEGTSRYLGVYTTKPDWRAYTNTTGNTKDQTLGFYKLTGGSGKPAEPELPFEDGNSVIIYNVDDNAALSEAENGYYGYTSVTDEDVKSWTVSEAGSGFVFSDEDGELMFPNGAGASGWEVIAAEADGFFVKSIGENKNYLEWYAADQVWRAESDALPSEKAPFIHQFKVLSQEDPQPVIVPISTALAGADGTSFTVKGVVTLVDGQNIYLQDATGGICVRMSATPTDISLGDTVIGTGSKTVYNGLPQLGSGTYEKSSGLTLAAKDTTIGALATGDICTYVKLSGVEVTKVDDNNGAYSNPNITVRDGTNTIQIYKAVVGKTDGENWDIQVGDVVDITAAVSCYKTTLQLRNTLASEITKAAPAPTGPLADGDKVVIYNPANLKALSTTYTGFYNNGTDVTVAGGTVSGFTAADVWTVGVNADGTYTFTTSDGKKLSMGASYTSTPLDDVNPNWEVAEAATEGCYYIKNAARGNYLEWYASKGNWSSYTKVGDEALFAQKFYKVTEIPGPTPGTGLPSAGDQVMLYNVAAEGVLALQDDNVESPSITSAAATVADGKVTAANGGLVFTVEKNGDYYRFRNETFGYLCSNGTGNNAFYAAAASEDADWTLAERDDGYTMESRTAKYNGKYSQYLEFYADAYKTYSMYNVTDYSIYTFQFLPYTNKNLTGGVVNQPAVDFGTLAEAYVGMEYTFTFTVDAVFGVAGELTVKVGATELTTNQDGSYTIPAGKVTGDSLTITVTGKDTKGVAISGAARVTVKDEPVISGLTPAAGSETGSNKRPTISADIANAGENPTVTVTVNGEAVNAVYANGKVSYIPAADLADGRTTVTVTVKRADGKEATKSWAFTVGKAQFQLYFGQLHSHTQYSDGSGTLDSALEYIANLPESANVDFAAFTDHSNYFDKSGDANPEGALYDMSLATEYSQGVWSEYKSKVAAFNASQSDVIALGGFEMTWSGGPGHINTWNTPGIVSRNNSTLNNKTADAGMKAYYALLSQAEGADSVSQLNHPGSTFGTFADFSYWDPVIDNRVYLVEVGNGEGQIGAGGYYPSYEYYTMALDKGWHVAPSNNQDNHKGKWGNANDARDVILTDDFSEEGLYEAIRNYRVYATEDKNLAITYTVNGQMLGSQLPKDVDALEIAVTLNDPDRTDSISKVEVIVNSGKTAYTWSDPAELASGALTATLAPDYSYYYIRVTEGDGDIAVTAPVWVGETLKLGISSVECGTSTPVTGEALTLTTTLFNSEASDAVVKSVTYTAGDMVLGKDETGCTVPASGTASVDFRYTPDAARVMTVKATVVMEQDGKEYTFSMDIELDVLNADSLVYIGIDASHYNEYVAGNYKDSMGNFGKLTAGYSVRTVELKTSDDLIAACSDPKYRAVVLTAPSRRDGSALRNPYATYSDGEIAALVEFNRSGGTVVLCGWGDYYESYSPFPAEDHMAAQQNKVLAALGSSIRISDDETKDDTWNGGQSQRLYLSSYNFDSFLLDGVEYDAENPHNNMYTELYSQYGGASIYVVDGDGNATATVPATVTPVVYGFDTTNSIDDDKDSYGGLGSTPKYTFDGADRLMVMATEQLEGQGLIVVAGAAFLSNFEVQASISDSGSEKNYSNYKICENLVQKLNPIQITDIAEVQAQTEKGYKYTIEGIVTSNASGYDKDTAFFDCIYVQDETGGVCCFPVAGNFKVGNKVRVTGTTDFYQGEMELQVTSIEKIGEGAVEPVEVTAAQINDGSVLGQLITLKGKVLSFELANGLVQTILVKDAKGNVARVFIDGYITTDEDVKGLKVGCKITATGLASYDDTFNAPEGPFPRIRIRDRADIVCAKSSSSHKKPSQITEPDLSLSAGAFVDLDENAWYYEDVDTIVQAGLMQGISDTRFAPSHPLNRAMMAVILHRMSQENFDGHAAFADVSADSWYDAGIAWANANGIVLGYSEAEFGPEDAITRQQTAAMLYRYHLYTAGDVSVRGDLSAFADADQVSPYAKEAMEWAVGNGLIIGYTDNTLAPAKQISRAELCTILVRYMNLGK